MQTRIEIARLHRKFSEASMIYVTHDQVEAMTLADKIVLLHSSGADVAKKGSLATLERRWSSSTGRVTCLPPDSSDRPK